MADELPPLATLEQLKSRIPGGIKSDDEARAEANLEDASSAVRNAAHRTWVNEEGELEGVPPIAVTITLAAAKRAFINPFDYRSEQIGEYAYQGAVGMLLPEERADLETLSGDLVSVDMDLPYKPSSPTQRFLDSYRREQDAWL